MKIDINSDIGEHFGIYKLGDDSALMRVITSANIACGFHAGDPVTMKETVKLALDNGVSIGAHPGFNDREGFGRRNMTMKPEEITALMLYQIGALDAFVKAAGGTLQHVKPHGALYNMAAVDESMALAIVSAIHQYNSNLELYGLAGSMLENAAKEIGIPFKSEVFADRNVDDQGLLIPRTHAKAVIHDVDICAKRIIEMVTNRRVLSLDGNWVPMRAETICVHGDHVEAIAFANKLVEILKANAIDITSK